MNSSLAEAATLARQGQATRSIQLLEQQVAATGTSYPLASNLAALHLQLGNLSPAASYCAQAVALDPYCHTAYFNRFLCLLASSQPREAARKELHKALSCLYCLQGWEQGSPRKLNKAISYCQQNARAYLWRAKLNEGRNNKLAQNDYSAAIEYDPNLAEIYQQRALFLRSLGRVQEFEQDCSAYLRLKQERNSITELVDNEALPDNQPSDANIREEVREFEDLLLKMQRPLLAPSGLSQSGQLEGMGKLPLSSIQSKLDRKEDEQMLLSDRNEVASAQTIAIKKEEIQFKKKGEKEKNFREIFEDESSTELDMKIVNLEREIERQGGKVATQREEPQELDVSDPDHFLTQEIEKAINEITLLSTLEKSEVKSVRSVNSRGSRVSEPRELSLEDFNSFHTIAIEIVSLEDLNNHGKKETSKVVLKYGERVCETSMGKYYWREKFTFGLSGGLTELEVTVIEKGGIFRGDLKVGEGSINLLETHNVKCILGNQDKKVAILYFEVELR